MSGLEGTLEGRLIYEIFGSFLLHSCKLAMVPPRILPGE